MCQEKLTLQGEERRHVVAAKAETGMTALLVVAMLIPMGIKIRKLKQSFHN